MFTGCEELKNEKQRGDDRSDVRRIIEASKIKHKFIQNTYDKVLIFTEKSQSSTKITRYFKEKVKLIKENHTNLRKHLCSAVNYNIKILFFLQNIVILFLFFRTFHLHILTFYLKIFPVIIILWYYNFILIELWLFSLDFICVFLIIQTFSFNINIKMSQYFEGKSKNKKTPQKIIIKNFWENVVQLWIIKP